MLRASDPVNRPLPCKEVLGFRFLLVSYTLVPVNGLMILSGPQLSFERYYHSRIFPLLYYPQALVRCWTYLPSYPA